MKYSFYIFTLYFFLSTSLNAQTWLWAKGTSGTGSNEGTAINTDASGNVFITGAFQGPVLTLGTYSLVNAGILDIYIAKYDANGTLIWAKRFGGNQSDIAYSVCTDLNGDILVTGIFRSPSIVFGTYTLTNAGSENIFLAKFDTNGNVLWAKRAGGTQLDEAYSVRVDAVGNIYITGRFNSPSITFGASTLTTSGSYDIFIAKFDINGNPLWAQRAGGSNLDEGWAVDVDNLGNVLLTGRYSSSTISFGSTTLTNVGLENAFLVKYSPLGNVLWAKNAGGTGSDAGIGISTDGIGNTYVTGRFSSSTFTANTTILTNTGGIDIFLIKYDSNGNVVWAKNPNGNGNDIGWCVSADSTGAFLGASFYFNFSSPSTIILDTYTFTPSSNSIDPMFIAKYDVNGNVSCASYLSSGGDDLFGVKIASNGNAYMVNDHMTNPLVIGTNSLSLTGTENVFVAKFNCSDPLKVEEFNSISTINIYPNPNNGMFNINIEDNIKNGKFLLFNSLGQKIFEEKVYQGQNNIISKGLSPGFYNYIILDDKIQIKKGKLSIVEN